MKEAITMVCYNYILIILLTPQNYISILQVVAFTSTSQYAQHLLITTHNRGMRYGMLGL